MRKLISMAAGAAFVVSVATAVFAADMTVKGEPDVACSVDKKEAGKGEGTPPAMAAPRRASRSASSRPTRSTP